MIEYFDAFKQHVKITTTANQSFQSTNDEHSAFVAKKQKKQTDNAAIFKNNKINALACGYGKKH